MAYTPTEWASGDVVTSQKLNKLEQGVAGAGGVLAVHAVEGALDKTWKELYTALNAGCYVCLVYEGNQTIIYEASFNDGTGTYMISAYGLSLGMTISYTTDSEDGYPSTRV